jgi:hypothetical protein
MRGNLIVLLLAVIVVMSGCDGSTKNANSSNTNADSNKAENLKTPPPIRPLNAVDPAFKTCNAYFPLVPGSVAKYVVNYSSGIVADLTVVVDAADEEGRKVFTQRSQMIDRSGGMRIIQTVTRKFVCDGERVQILSEVTDSNIEGQQSSAEFQYRDNSLVMLDPKSMSLKGSTWQHAFRTIHHRPGESPAVSDEPTIIVFEVTGPQEVITPVGTFKTIGVMRKVRENTVMDYYTAGLGLVKRQSKEGTSWEIKEYSGLKPQDL